MKKIDLTKQDFGRNGSYADGHIFSQTDKQIRELYYGMAFMKVLVGIHGKLKLPVHDRVWWQLKLEIEDDTD